MSDFSSPTVMGLSPIRPINPTRTKEKCQISKSVSNLPSIHCTVTCTCTPCIVRSRVQPTNYVLPDLSFYVHGPMEVFQ